MRELDDPFASAFRAHHPELVCPPTARRGAPDDAALAALSFSEPLEPLDDDELAAAMTPPPPEPTLTPRLPRAPRGTAPPLLTSAGRGVAGCGGAAGTDDAEPTAGCADVPAVRVGAASRAAPSAIAAPSEAAGGGAATRSPRGHRVGRAAARWLARGRHRCAATAAAIAAAATAASSSRVPPAYADRKRAWLSSSSEDEDDEDDEDDADDADEEQRAVIGRAVAIPVITDAARSPSGHRQLSATDVRDGLRVVRDDSYTSFVERQER